jgi:phosphotriesterase-related protein
MAQVQTVLGPVDGSQLGVVLSHEHVLISMGEDARHYPWMYDWQRTRANVVRELREAEAGGVGTIVELTTPDLGRNAAFYGDVAAEAGIHVIAATGIWRDIPRSFWSRDPDAIADIFVREIEVGIEDTGIRAGVIKVANDAEGVTAEAELILRGAARALKRTGCPISTHHWAPKEVGRRQVEIFLDEGAPMDRVCIGHSADTADVDYLESLLKTGVYLSMDRYPGGEGRPQWRERNATVKALVERGWAHRLMLGHDHAPSAVLAGAPAETAPPERTRYLFVPLVAVPALREAGVSDADIEMMLKESPRRFLTGA